MSSIMQTPVKHEVIDYMIVTSVIERRNSEVSEYSLNQRFQ